MPRPCLYFATPLPQSPRSEILEWTFPPPYQHLTLTGRSRAAWHTSFVIPSLSLLLDCGLVVNNLRPRHVFITHGHNDHCLLAPAFLKGPGPETPPEIYCPKPIAEALETFCQGSIQLNKFLPPVAADAPRGHGRYLLRGVEAGEGWELKTKDKWTVEAFDCDHSLPCLGYLFSVTNLKLKPEFAGLKGPEIKALRQKGVEITAPVTTPVFAFLGDTTIKTLQDEPDWLKNGVKVVITECSFLYEKHRDQAVKTKHTIWKDLEPVIRKWKETTFVLIHFSMRYSEKEIIKFFRDMENPPQNMVIWTDGEPDAHLPEEPAYGSDEWAYAQLKYN
ncbi:nuclear ribonuclease Z [Podospora australis]|uniref:Nuclear ribonuclease Z n=1 Tax=Podospora australis TaxID=1536484 RepID=A0AAN6WSQ8_9PEZI|nr:nuclear ribonuclease Z [Podospora australis]